MDAATSQEIERSGYLH
ncbi:hypothetical protein CLOP_g19051, partial [Closterium sp. NIES-67]